MTDSNYLIINRKAQRFTGMRLAGSAAVFFGDGGRVLDYGVIRLDGNVYAAMCCDEVCNITLITGNGRSWDVVTLLWRSPEEYRHALGELGGVLHRRFSSQNKLINRYAESVAEKLSWGVQLRVTDAADESEMIRCPECGMMNPAGSEYCLECGADLV